MAKAFRDLLAFFPPLSHLVDCFSKPHPAQQEIGKRRKRASVITVQKSLSPAS